MSAMFGHGRLRLYLLALLEDRPRHGYEIIQELEERSGGTYSPSAGTVYPRLGKLEEEGLVERDADGRRTIYAITDAGRAELDSRRGELGSIEEDLADSVRRIADEVRTEVDQAMKSLRAELVAAAKTARDEATNARTAASSTGDPSRVVREVDAAVARLRHELRSDLRTASARRPLPAEVLPLVEERLRSLREDVAQLLR